LCLAAALLAVGLSGCAGWDTHDEGFHKNDFSESVRQARPPKTDTEHWSFSSKGRQIEDDLNAM